MVNKKFVGKVWQNKTNKQKLVTIPSKEKISNGDYVTIQRVILK